MWIQFSQPDGIIQCTCSESVAEPIIGYVNGEPQARGQMQVDDTIDVSQYMVDITQSPPILVSIPATPSLSEPIS